MRLVEGDAGLGGECSQVSVVGLAGAEWYA